MIIKTNELISNSLNLYSVSKESVAISDQEELNDLADYISQHNLKYFFRQKIPLRFHFCLSNR